MYSSIQIDFNSGLLVSADGIPYDSITGVYSLSDPSFVASYYN